MDRFSFYRLLGEAACRVNGAYDVFSKSTGIKSNMLWMLSALNDGKKHTQVQLSWDWNYPKTTVNTLVKELEEDGYVQFSPVPGAKREMYVELTESGTAYADEILRPVYEAEEALFQQYFSSHDTHFVQELNRFSNSMKLFFTTGKYEVWEEEEHESNERI